MIAYAAPGKAVIWGEYAVLEGAPALVMAINRYASARIRPGGADWRMIASGFSGDQTLSARALKNLDPALAGGPAATVRAALTAFDTRRLPPGAEVHTDTTRFHDGASKLGIGSSAAVCTATCAALAELLGESFSYEKALAAHQALQGSSGSGLDVAAACQGGLLRFQRGSAEPTAWPEALKFRFFWVGHPAKTTDHLARFAAWRAKTAGGTLDALCQASESLFRQTDLVALRTYTECLKAMDQAAGLGIYDAAHKRLDELAIEAQVVYKPCGAGGGDIGIAVGDDASALESLTTLAARENYLTLDLEIAAHGVHRIRE